ncbi:long-chain-fatty-acid--CoA ligase [Paraoerskovia sediminicola]|uniref:Long-chain-fatty-acid--CoA ligase n=1 Tax=Paraoerskovia sediminicola TaxID=1138587 RepID=A0ABN6XAJ1_9CELL|nr:AMP-binding protein [Paraoerskovia sediminicola]BDZ41720.1 long-chain-fatty-acid--CoA ligase [Paraoerskovia sediminicola]
MNPETATPTHRSRPWLAHYAPGVPATVTVPDEDLTSALVRAAERWPDRVAVDFFGATTTFAELADETARAARVLADLGVRAGDRVALVMPNCAAHVAAFYGILRLGAIAVEHNPTYPVDQMRHQLTDSGATVALVWDGAVATVVEACDGTAVRHLVAVDMTRDLPTTKRLALRLPVSAARETRTAMTGPVPAGTRRWHRLVAAAEPLPLDALDERPRPSSDDVALLQYTGGTTGVPKAAVLTHRNLVANVVQGHAWAQFRPGEEVVHGVLPFFHAFGLTLCMTLPVAIGATLVPFPKFDPDAVVASSRRRPATFMAGVAPMFDRLVDAAERSGHLDALTSIRLAFAGAMPISAATAARWEAATGGLLIEGYGMTETSPVAVGNPCTAERTPGTLGLPFPSTDARVVVQGSPDEPSGPVDAEPGADDGPEAGLVRGELLLRGPQVFSGYWQRPDESAGVLLDGGWIRTGDVVTQTPEGVLTLVDRVKEMIITGGFKVFPSQVEDVLRGMPGIDDVAVVGMPDAGGAGSGDGSGSGGAGGTEHVVAAIVISGVAPTLEAVRAWGEKHLARYALPRKIVVVRELPRSQIGKVLRRVVREDLLRRP